MHLILVSNACSENFIQLMGELFLRYSGQVLDFDLLISSETLHH